MKHIMRKIMTSRKAQFYIFAAVILSVVAFSLAKPRETPLERDTTFNDLYENYVMEAAKSTDNAILDDLDLESRFEMFNNDFKTYSNSKNIRFGFLGILSHDDNITFHNKMNQEVELNYLATAETLSAGHITSINWSEQVQVEYNNNFYVFNFSKGLTEVKGLFYAKASNYEKIYAYN